MSYQLFSDDIVFLQRLLKSESLYTDKIDGIWGPNTDKAVTQFEAQSKAIAEQIMSFDSRSERNIQTLNLKAQSAARLFLKAVLSAGISARIISGTRTYAEQDHLYGIGRNGNPGHVVTNARGGQSNHNFGIAWDIGVFENGNYLPESPLYDQAAKTGLDALPQLEWGGDWHSITDRPHFQLATGLSISEVRQRFEAGQAYV